MKDLPELHPIVEFGPFTFDKAAGKLCKNGSAIRLRGMPLRILQHLVEHPGETVSRAELQQLLWSGITFGNFENGLNTAMNVVRKTLGDSAEEARYIETISGQGYRFVATVRPALETHPTTGVIASELPATENRGAEEPSTVRDREANRKFAVLISRWGVGVALVLVALSGVVRTTLRSKPVTLIDGSTPSPNREANDQYNLAFGFLSVQNDIPLARKTFERAIELDPHFASAHLQRALAILIEAYNGYANDENALYQAEEDIHQVEHSLPASDFLLLSAQAGVYLGEGRLDRIPYSKLESEWRTGISPVWLVILRMLREQRHEDSLAILAAELNRNPLDNPVRMFRGELLRQGGDFDGAIQTLERTIQQGRRHPTAAWFLTMAYLDKGTPEPARALLEGMRSEFQNNFMWRHSWAILLAAEGKREEAREAMNEETLKFARLAWSVTSTTADFYALQGDIPKAMEWLRLAVSRGDERVGYFRRNPRLVTLRTNPQFQSLLKSVEDRRKAE